MYGNGLRLKFCRSRLRPLGLLWDYTGRGVAFNSRKLKIFKRGIQYAKPRFPAKYEQETAALTFREIEGGDC